MEKLPLEDLILLYMKSKESLNSLELAKEEKVEHEEIVGQFKSLETDLYLELEQSEIEQLVLTDEGKRNLTYGTPESRIYQLISQDGIKRDELKNQFLNKAKSEWAKVQVKGQDYEKFSSQEFDIGWTNAMKKKIIEMEKGTQLVKRKQQNVIDEEQKILDKINTQQQIEKPLLDQLKKRKQVEIQKTKFFIARKGKNYQEKRSKLETNLTKEMLANKSWKTAQLKKQNWDSLGKEISQGSLHPLMKVRQEFREVMIDMGFEEMQTNKFIESSFWNFDALDIPQEHPARDEHDTFFLKDPEKSAIADLDYAAKIKKVHEQGDYGSIGYRYNWNIEESKKNVFRTHTTAVSSRVLYAVAQDVKKNGFQPKKYFSIDRVFRNETLDATHLAEFHQIEGVVLDVNVGLGDLMGFLTVFFQKIGITKLKFKPCYNPYTEPSLEVYGWHPVLKKMVEVGNSGVFRPEMLMAMGFPKDVMALGWGLGLERPTMIQYGIANIRDLMGYKVDIKYIKNNPICCFK